MTKQLTLSEKYVVVDDAKYIIVGEGKEEISPIGTRFFVASAYDYDTGEEVAIYFPIINKFGDGDCIDTNNPKMVISLKYLINVWDIKNNSNI